MSAMRLQNRHGLCGLAEDVDVIKVRLSVLTHGTEEVGHQAVESRRSVL